jgi:ABC-2 type transport system permease protein
MSAILALAAKDLRILFRVKAGLFFTFVWPVIVAVLFGFVFSGQSSSTPRAVRVVVVDEDQSAGSQAFINVLETSGDFAVDRASRADAETMVRRGQRSAYVVLKSGFGAASQRMFYGEPRRIEIGNDPARAAEASMIEGLLTKHAMSDVQKLFTDPAQSRQMIAGALGDLSAAGNASPATPLRRFLGELDTFLGTPQSQGPGGAGGSGWQPLTITKAAVVRERVGPTNGFDITFPQGVMWGIIGCIMSFAIGLVSERVHGTFVRLQMAPLTRGQLLAGKALACFASISLLQVLLFSIGVVGFGIRISSLPLLIVACVSASAGFVGFMMMIAGMGRTEQGTSGAGWAMLMPMTMFGGGMMPQFVMPPWMQTVGNLSPVKWAILGLEGAVWRNFTVAEMLLPTGILLAFGAVCFALGVRALRDA